MANTFTRFPIPGGDSNVGALYNEAQLYATLGTLSGKLYNDGGALKVPLCRIGIDNGTHKGLADIDTITTVSLAGCSNSTWLAVEMEVSGTVPSFTATDIAAATDPTIIPASVRAAWDGRKGGYYLTATKRLVGLAWRNSSGVLLAVVNFEGRTPFASQIGRSVGTIYEQCGPGMGLNFGNTVWDMDAVEELTIASIDLDVFARAIKAVAVNIWSPALSNSAPLTALGSAVAGNLAGGVTYVDSYSGGNMVLRRHRTGYFDNANYNAAVASIVIHMREF